MANIGITATRDGLTGPQLLTIRRRLLPFTIQGAEVDTLHQGCCVGGDEQITILASALGFHVCAHPPVDQRYYFSQLAWELSEKRQLPLSFLDRNKVIVDHSDILIAAPKTKSDFGRSGTWSTIRYALSNRVPTVVVYSDGGYDDYTL